MSIEIAAFGSGAELEQDWVTFVQGHDADVAAVSLEIEDEYAERAIDGGSTLTIIALSTGFVTGVGSGLIANWLTHLIVTARAQSITVGKEAIDQGDQILGDEEKLRKLVRSELEDVLSKNKETKENGK